ncbi:VOC family protein [Streptomyces sp. NPDC002454]
MIDLMVIYTDRLDACRDFYADLGLVVIREQHGDGPEHYASTTLPGTVFELYPTSLRRPATGALRLGITLPHPPGRTPAHRTLTDPDGRTVVLTVPL